MSKQPLEKRAGQTVEEMAAQLQTQEGNRLFPSKANYKDVAESYKQEALSSSIALQAELLARARERGRIDLSNVRELEAAADEYMRACQRAGAYPTFTAFCASLGHSRQGVYAWISRNSSTDSARFLDTIRSSWASVLMQMALSRNASEAVAIFLLNNSNLGFTNQTQLDVYARQENSPLQNPSEADIEAIVQKYELLMEGDEMYEE